MNNATESATADLAPGKYYFRIVSGSMVLSTTNQFTVALADVARLLYPTKKQKIEVVGEDGQAQLRWLSFDVGETGKHTLEVSGDA